MDGWIYRHILEKEKVRVCVRVCMGKCQCVRVHVSYICVKVPHSLCRVVEAGSQSYLHI